MKRVITIITLITLFTSCGSHKTFVQDEAELTAALRVARPGDVVIMADGVWQDVPIRFGGYGELGSPITLRAQTPGKVFLEGQSSWGS